MTISSVDERAEEKKSAASLNYLYFLSFLSMSLPETSNDLGRISLYDFNISEIELSSLDMQLRNHTGYNEEHLKRLKYLFQQITEPNKDTLDIDQFELAARSLCRSLTASSEAHHLAEILFKAYDRNTNDLIDFHEMVEFVW